MFPSMPGDFDYNNLLKRAKEKMPETLAAHERFVIPPADVLIEGKSTVLKNFGDIVETIRRDQSHVLQYLLRELGTAGTVQGRRLVFKGKVGAKQIDDRINSFVETFVLCTECGRPDTRLVKDGRTLVLECDACGGHRPLKVKKTTRTQEAQAAALEEGKVYEVMVQDVGRKGDGVAKVDKYIIYIPGTTKGAKVKVKIDKISGSVAFARLAE